MATHPVPDTNRIIGERLRRQRRRLNLSAEDVGQSLGLMSSAILRYEDGAPLRVETLLRLAALLRQDASEFLKDLD